MTGVVEKFIFGIFITIAWVVYTLLAFMYNLFFKLADHSLVSESVMEGFYIRVWSIIGIIMIFKLAISLVKMVAEPSSFNNAKTGGFGKIVTRTMTALVMLAFLNTGFRTLYRFQALILKNDIIPKVILGSGSNSTKESDMGANLAYNLFKTMYDFENSDKKEKIEEKIKSMKFKEWGSLAQYVDGDQVKYYLFLDIGLGLFVTYQLIVFSIDIAIRMLKMTVLQLLAPIPIISYVDNDSLLQKWFKEVMSTYTLVFIRVAILYFVSYIITLIINKNNVYCELNDMGGTENCKRFDLWTLAFLIIGLFIFAKEVTNLISKVTGLELQGGMFSLKDRLGKAGIKNAPTFATLGGAALGYAGGKASALTGKLTGGRFGSNIGMRKNDASGYSGKTRDLVEAENTAKSNEKTAGKNVEKAQTNLDNIDKNLNKNNDDLRNANAKHAAITNQLTGVGAQVAANRANSASKAADYAAKMAAYEKAKSSGRKGAALEVARRAMIAAKNENDIANNELSASLANQASLNAELSAVSSEIANLNAENSTLSAARAAAETDLANAKTAKKAAEDAVKDASANLQDRLKQHKGDKKKYDARR